MQVGRGSGSSSADRFEGAVWLSLETQPSQQHELKVARAGIYPALDRQYTRSSAAVSPEHAALSEAVRASESQEVPRFFQQWFGVNQHRTTQAGAYWRLADTLAGFAERLGN